MENEIAIEVVYALPDEQVVIELALPAGTTAGEALMRSGLAARFPEIRGGEVRLGVYGRPVEATVALAAGDRLEIYRPLTADPKQARRRRARGG